MSDVFLSLHFLMLTLRNILDTHLRLVVGLCSQRQFNLADFPYDKVYLFMERSIRISTVWN